MAQDKQALLNYITRLNDQLFLKIFNGTFQIPEDIQTLRKHANTALALDAPVNAAWVIFTIGGAYLYNGELDRAEQEFEQAYELAASVNDYKHMAAALSNMGEVSRHRGDYETALEKYIRGLALLRKLRGQEDSATTSLTFDGVQSNLLSNRGHALLKLGRFDEAEESFTLTLQLVRTTNRTTSDAMTEAHLGMAEVYLSRHQFTEAWRSLGVAMSAAESVNNIQKSAECHLTAAHIAQADHNAETSATEHYQTSRDLLSQIGDSVLEARLIIDEARYQLKHGNTDMAISLAVEAHERFVELGMEEEATLARTLTET